MMKRPSELLNDILHAPDGGEITMGDFVELLGDRSFALIILIFALPNIPPLGIPGISTITALPILFMALQILGGRDTIWLPSKVAQKRFEQKRLTKVISKMLPAVLWLEKFLRPRLTMLCESVGERAIGFLIIVMGLILILPVIGGNFLPGVAIALLALALLAKDGFLAAFGILFSLVSLSIMCSVVVVASESVIEWIAG